MATINYNERSWAIDVISEINTFILNKSWHFKGAGGENTILEDKKSLFPDVLLFKDISKDSVLQGWELKMPDTPINDENLINNAIKKAQILKRESFVLWNVKSAVLYSKNGGGFTIFKAWSDIDINIRAEVKPKEILWKELLHTILNDLNLFFESGKINSNTTTEIISIEDVIDIVLENTSETGEFIKSKTNSDALLDVKIDQWWFETAGEYGFKSNEIDNKYSTLSMVVLTDWVFKIVFANVLKKHFNEAEIIESISFRVSIQDAIDTFKTISDTCNFWNIFSENIAQKFITENAWYQITALNKYLSNINIESIEIEVLQSLLQSTVETGKRKIAGQFSTPSKLAELLTRLTINDKTKNVIDPCCGTGTIIKQAYLLKEEYHQNQEQILSSIWASDKHSFPIQLSTLSLTKAENIGKILNVFTSDVINLEFNKQIEFKDPNNGEVIRKDFPEMDYVVSNLPFIKSEDIHKLNSEITEVNEWIQQEAGLDIRLSLKSDIFTYIPFYLHKFLSTNGKIGLILSNAWLGTNYGERFLSIFQKFYKIEKVIISGKGKWFDNAAVVTTILIAEKKSVGSSTNNDHQVSFITIQEHINRINDVKKLSGDIFLQEESDLFKINSYSQDEIKIFERMGIPWSAYFTNLTWLPDIQGKLIRTNQVFNFTRGQRRGWNSMFYPQDGHGIESEYIKPVLKNLDNTKSLDCAPNKQAFCCSKSIAELESLGHTGAISWINSFEHKTNGVNKPLPEVLSRPNMFWYEMKADNTADFVANVNFHNSLFIAKLSTRSLIDQRVIGFSVQNDFENESNDLFLALFNSVLSMFFIESFGFGRGLGALDLREEKFKRDFKMLDHNRLTDEQKETIVSAFGPIKDRDRLPLEEELVMSDRINFESILMDIYGITEHYEQIKQSLLEIFRIRFAVKD